MEGEGGGVDVMLTGAPDWEGGDPSMMSSESTVDREAGRQQDKKNSSESKEVSPVQSTGGGHRVLLHDADLHQLRTHTEPPFELDPSVRCTEL